MPDTQNFTQLYSRYYNALYQDKDYLSEVEYIEQFLSSKSNVLDIGCGTGKHLKVLQEKGYEIFGVDMSGSQIEQARKLLGANANLQQIKASEFYFNQKFDNIISLFHVMSYQTQNDELQKVFANVCKHLSIDGIFVFDFWHGTGVLNEPPTVRIKRLGEIIRLAEPVMRYEQNVVEVNYEIIIGNESIKEQHSMRYFFLPELEIFAINAGLKLIAAYKWLTKEPLGTAWYGTAILRREE
jgi:SAM-dependent methyltransferase